MPSHIKTVAKIFDNLSNIIQSKLNTFNNGELPNDIGQKLFHPQRTELPRSVPHANKSYQQAWLTTLTERHANVANKRSEEAEHARTARFDATDAINHANKERLKQYANPTKKLTKAELKTYAKSRKAHLEDLTQAISRRQAGSNTAILAKLKQTIEAASRVAADNPEKQAEMDKIKHLRSQSNFNKAQFATLFAEQVLPNRDKKISEKIRSGFTLAIQNTEAAEENYTPLMQK